MAKLLGGGTVRKILVSEVEITARMNVFGLGFGIISDPPKHAGKLLVRNVDRDIWQIVMDIYHGYRQTWHILAKYGLDYSAGETPALLKALKFAESINEAVVELPSEATIRDVQSVTQHALQSLEAILRLPRDRAKRSAREQVLALKSGNDSQGRVNPSAAQARLTRLDDRLRMRVEDGIMSIDPRMAMRQRAFINMIRFAQYHLRVSHNFLTLMNRRRSFEFDLRHRRALAVRFLSLARALSRLDFNPYREMGSLTAQDMFHIVKLLQHSRFGREELHTFGMLQQRCTNAVGMKMQQIELERMLFQIMRSMQHRSVRFDTDSAARRIETVRDALSRMDDRMFRKPIRTKALASLTEALVDLAGKQPDLKVVKQHLKDASATL